MRKFRASVAMILGVVGAIYTSAALAGDIIILAGIVAKYSHSSSPAGTVANAKAIMAQPNAPTAAQVDSATATK